MIQPGRYFRRTDYAEGRSIYRAYPSAATVLEVFLEYAQDLPAAEEANRFLIRLWNAAEMVKA